MYKIIFTHFFKSNKEVNKTINTEKDNIKYDTQAKVYIFASFDGGMKLYKAKITCVLMRTKTSYTLFIEA